jgi:hypothetical protein
MGSKTITVMKCLVLPILAELPCGYVLAAHPNGPVVATKTFLCTLDVAVSETSASVAVAAIKEYQRITWPLLQAEAKQSKWDLGVKEALKFHDALARKIFDED